MPRTLKRVLALALLLLLLLSAYFGYGILKSLRLESSLITLRLWGREGQEGRVRIAQVSDLHFARFGENNEELIELVASKKPDIILATGDMIDARAETIAPTVDVCARLAQIAPLFYSLGNHEMARQDLRELIAALEDAGITVLNNATATTFANGVPLTIGGVYRAENLPALSGPNVDILLCHFPDKINILSTYGIPLTFSGHTHGGQFRIPFFHIPLYAPGQGIFPAYTAGLYTEGDSHMIVSRGLGNSSFPFRMYNPPEVVIADITYIPEADF